MKIARAEIQKSYPINSLYWKRGQRVLEMRWWKEDMGVYDRWTSKRNSIVSHGGMEKNVRLERTIKELSQFDNKKTREAWVGAAANSFITSPFKGCNIVDLDFVYKQLLDGHKPCNTTLSLTQHQRERLIDLTSTLYLSLQNFSAVMMVKTSIYDVNGKCAADTYTKLLLWVYLWVRIILCKLISFLSELDIYWAETWNKIIIWKHSS